MPDSPVMSVYYRPLAQSSPCPKFGSAIAGGWCWFDHAERLERGRKPEIVPTSDVPDAVLRSITRPRQPISGLKMDQPRLMAIVNVTPDSFSDGGQFLKETRAVDHGLAMVWAGADIIDIGGESTRPGAAEVPEAEEVARTQPVVSSLHDQDPVPISIDTRKASVAAAALTAGAVVVNDVSALTFDADMAKVVAKSGAALCLMHACGGPATMQDDPTYENVLLDVYDFLAERISFAQSCGVRRERIMVDPGIGFGKTTQHCIALLTGISLLHGLGCPILLGTSRKRFIGDLAGEPDANARLGGSVAVALSGISQGVQITRAHDIAQIRQALTLWSAVNTGQTP